MNLNHLYAVIYITFMDGLRKRSIIGLIIFAAMMIVGGTLFMDFFGRDIGKASIDYLFSIMWLCGFIFLLFHAVSACVLDDEHRNSLTALARPISRNEYITGTFIGLAILLGCLQLLLGIASYGILQWVQQSIDTRYFPYFSTYYFLLSVIGVILQQYLLLAVIIFFATLLRGIFPVMLATISYQLIDSGIPVVRKSIQQALEAGHGSHSSPSFMQIVAAFFPDLNQLDFKNLISTPFLHVEHLGLSLLSIVIYICILLSLACFIYKKKDLY